MSRGSRLRELRWRAVHWVFQTAQRDGMVTADTPAGRRFAAFGRGSMAAFPQGSVFGERWITVGEDTLIAAQVTLSAGMVPGQDLGPLPVLRIGDRCVIGRGSHIVAHHSLVIGDDVFTGPYVYITDQNHGYADPDIPIGRQMPLNDAVRIGSGSWLGPARWCCPAPASAATWSSRPARWCAARCRTGAWRRVSRPGWSGLTCRATAGPPDLEQG